MLKKGHGSFTKAFTEFQELMPAEVHTQIENIEAFYECDANTHEIGEDWETVFG